MANRSRQRSRQRQASRNKHCHPPQSIPPIPTARVAKISTRITSNINPQAAVVSGKDLRRDPPLPDRPLRTSVKPVGRHRVAHCSLSHSTKSDSTSSEEISSDDEESPRNSQQLGTTNDASSSEFDNEDDNEPLETPNCPTVHSRATSPSVINISSDNYFDDERPGRLTKSRSADVIDICSSEQSFDNGDSNDDDSDSDVGEGDAPGISTNSSTSQRFAHILRLVDISPDLAKLLVAGQRQLLSRRIKKWRDSNVNFSPRDSNTFTILCDLIPGLHEELLHMPEMDVKELAKKMDRAASAARGSDVCRLKKEVLKLLVHVDKTFAPEIESLRLKEKRGFLNRKLGEMLCPDYLDWSDSRIRNKLRAGKIVVNADHFPRFLYPNCSCNLMDMEKGLLRNEILVRVFKFIFTGPSSAFSKVKGGRSKRITNAQLAGMKEVTPRAIAYCACLLRFSISNKETWNLKDGDFDMHAFYWNIVDIFKDEDEFSKELLAWWNIQIFGSERPQARSKRHAGEMSSLQRLKAQRAVKRARRDAD